MVYAFDGVIGCCVRWWWVGTETNVPAGAQSLKRRWIPFLYVGVYKETYYFLYILMLVTCLSGDVTG